jgi:hypothetical protein
MKKLYNTATQQVTPYPRDDDAPVLGLDPAFIVLEAVEAAQPACDYTKQALSPVDAVDVAALTVTRTWVLRDLTPAELDERATMNAASALRTARAAMFDAFAALPLDARTAFFPVRLAVNAALDLGDIAVAKALVLNTAVPAELQSTKDAFLALFPAS